MTRFALDFDRFDRLQVERSLVEINIVNKLIEGCPTASGIGEATNRQALLDVEPKRRRFEAQVGTMARPSAILRARHDARGNGISMMIGNHAGDKRLRHSPVLRAVGEYRTQPTVSAMPKQGEAGVKRLKDSGVRDHTGAESVMYVRGHQCVRPPADIHLISDPGDALQVIVAVDRVDEPEASVEKPGNNVLCRTRRYDAMLACHGEDIVGWQPLLPNSLNSTYVPSF
ncbi:MAG: hypothetical protein H6707_02545 [Deltaproteobacteria bacterium]|nr:hypothetical protein [Deltaproteobacteria bacterium]